MQYTVRGVSAQLDAALRAEAERTGRSLNSVVLDHLRGATLPRTVHDDLDWFIGTGPGADRDEQDALDWLDAAPWRLA